MPCILNIETSTDICSLAVTQDGECLFYREDHSGPNHAIKLGIFVEQALSYVDSRNMTLDAVAVSCGPGSYTGLRIGTSMAKGICYGRNIKLISVPTLEILAVPVLLYNDIDDGSLICPMLDARRMEVYAAIYDKALNEIRPIQADIVDANTYSKFLKEHQVLFFGNGACKCIKEINNANAILIKDIKPLAKNMFPLAEKKYRDEKFEDVAYFVPFYLKDFVAQAPKKLI